MICCCREPSASKITSQCHFLRHFVKNCANFPTLAFLIILTSNVSFGQRLGWDGIISCCHKSSVSKIALLRHFWRYFVENGANFPTLAILIKSTSNWSSRQRLGLERIIYCCCEPTASKMALLRHFVKDCANFPTLAFSIILTSNSSFGQRLGWEAIICCCSDSMAP